MKKRPDYLGLLLGCSLPPIFMGINAIVAKELHLSRFIFHSYGKQAIIDGIALIIFGMYCGYAYFKWYWVAAKELAKNKHKSNLAFFLFGTTTFLYVIKDLPWQVDLLLFIGNTIFFIYYHVSIKIMQWKLDKNN